jgi:ankyrin repeat protein
MGSPLRVALAKDPPDAATIELLLRRRNASETGILPVVALKGNSLLGLFVEAGWDLEDRDEGGHTALMVAAEVGNRQAVDLLLQAGASPNSRNMFGQAALHRAVAASATEIVRLLLEAGADASAKDAEGNTPYLLARRTRTKFKVPLLGLYVAGSSSVPWETKLSKLIKTHLRRERHERSG